MSDTPRTDAATGKCLFNDLDGCEPLLIEARTIERELVEAKEDHFRLQERAGNTRADRDRWRKMAEELAERLQAVQENCAFTISDRLMEHGEEILTKNQEALSRFAITKSCHIIKSAWVP